MFDLVKDVGDGLGQAGMIQRQESWAIAQERLGEARLDHAAQHDAAYVELPNGRKFVLVAFTENHANERKILAAIAGEVRDAFAK